jgi:hypothetical protein
MTGDIAMTAKHPGYESDIADDEFRNGMGSAVFHDALPTAEIAQDILPVFALQAPSTNQPLVMTALQPFVGEPGFLGDHVFDVRDFEGLRSIEIPGLRQQGCRRSIFLVEELGNFADLFRQGHQDTKNARPPNKTQFPAPRSCRITAFS